MSIRLYLSPLLLVAVAASATVPQKTSPRDAAKAFTVEGLEPVPAPSASPVLAAPTVPESAEVATSTAPTVRAVFTLDSPIQELIADPRAKAVLDRDLPGMSDDENLDKFKMLSLRSLQPQTGGQLTDAMLRKVAADLDLLGGGSGAMPLAAPVKVGDSKRNRDASR